MGFVHFSYLGLYSWVLVTKLNRSDLSWKMGWAMLLSLVGLQYLWQSHSWWACKSCLANTEVKFKEYRLRESWNQQSSFLHQGWKVYATLGKHSWSRQVWLWMTCLARSSIHDRLTCYQLGTMDYTFQNSLRISEYLMALTTTPW